jgi:hypothetical protein
MRSKDSVYWFDKFAEVLEFLTLEEAKGVGLLMLASR